MKPFDDMLPEEKEPQHEELITLLQRAYRRPVFVPPAEQEQIINRVRERLIETDLRDSLNEDRPVSQIGVLDSFPHKPVSPAGMPRRDLPRFRLITLLAAALVIAVLLGTPLLLLRPRFSSSGHHQPGNKPGSAPALTLSSSVANVGSTVTLTIEHFSDSSHIALTHDIQEPILINGNSSFITTDSKGMATVHLVINKDWGPGFHSIVAEDVATRYIASATLQITGEGPTPLPHLLIDTAPINLGADVVGANTIHQFNLENKGGGSISWSASSNRSWLLVSPSQGMFSQIQTVSIVVQRIGLKPGDYKGTITISTNVSIPQLIEIDMSVRPLPPNAGPVIALSTALLSFTTADGDPDPMHQSLTISNPRSRPLIWSLSISAATCDWLSAPTTGTVAPGETSSINVKVQSQCLLPGVYAATLKFTAAGGAYDGSQSVQVSLTVQPHCGIVINTGAMAFTAVEGQNNPANQTLSLNATTSCAGTPITWKTSSSAPWLTISPASGQLKGTASAVVSVSVNAASMSPAQYNGNLSFVTGRSTVTVMVQLTVQAHPSPASPIMGTSLLSFNFSNTQGQPSPTGQVMTITNNGGGTLNWYTNVNILASSWLGTSPSSGSILPGQTGQVTINVNTSSLPPGNYEGQVILNGKDARGNNAPGSPQTITISLVIQPPCSISLPSSSALSFSAVQGASSNLTPQTVTFTGMGNCAWPVTWNTTVSPTANWLILSAPGGTTIKGTGQSGSIVVAANIAGLQAGTYTTEVTISSSDATGEAVEGSSQTFVVTLTVQPPCVLSTPAPANLAFSVSQGQSAATQNVTLSETGTCARPVTWNASANSAWLVLSPASGTGGTFGVTVDTAGLTPRTYTGTITVTATDGLGAAVSGSGQAINVTLTVTGYTISGNVVACPGSTPPGCITPQPLPGATVTLMSGSNTVATTIADASGNYAFSNIALGTYAISVAGYDASNNHYVGSLPLTLTGNALNIALQAFPG